MIFTKISKSMQPIQIKDIHDPQIAAFREVKDKQLAARHGLFIAEGEHLVKRLLASDVETRAILAQESRVAALDGLTGNTPLFTAPAALISQIVGFKFHRGVMALGVRPQLPGIQSLASKAHSLNRLVILPEINDVENLGGLMRTCAALGYNELVLGPSCCDPYARRAIRTSMGTVFKLNIHRSDDIVTDLKNLKNQLGFHFFAATIGTTASLPPARQKTGLLFGSEAHGLPQQIIAACDKPVSLDMAGGVDSLNVVVAAGIIMQHYRPK